MTLASDPSQDVAADEAPRDETLVVEGAMTYREAPELRQKLFDAIERGGRHLRVDLSRVEEMDTAALAVLVEALIATTERGPRIHLCSPSDEAQKIFQMAAFTRMMSEGLDRRLDEALRRCHCDEADSRGHRHRPWRRSSELR